MKLFERSASLPLGVDIGSTSVSVVSSRAAGDGFAVLDTCTESVPPADPGELDMRVAETIRRVVQELSTRERRCILAVPSGDVITRIFHVPPGMRSSEAERAALLEADLVVDWPRSERLVALDPLPDRAGEMLLSIARNATVERLAAVARAGGLQPVAVDVPACAWRRAVRDADAVLNCFGERAELVIFGSPLGLTQLFPPRLIDDRLATGIRTALVDARRDGICDVQRLAILATPYRYESIEPLLRGDGYAIDRFSVAGFDAPPWTFAFGLASWSVAERGLR
jgi:hypothetical protein